MKAVKGKIRFALWLKPETMEKVRTASAQNDCGSLSEFIVAESDHRHASMLFKLSVEMAMLMNIVAATQEIDKLTLERLRGECVKEVKRLNGTFSMEDAVNWQSS